MKRHKFIESLIAKAGEELQRVRDRYPSAIDARSTDTEFDILVNDCFHHLRQSLDFIAHDIYESYRSSPRRIYFPFADRGDTRPAFEAKLRKWFPGLSTAKTKAFKLLSDIQEFRSDSWLFDFHEISNTNKHDNIYGHTFRASLSIGDGAAIIHSGGTLEIIPGVTLTINSLEGTFRIPGPRTITGNTSPGGLLSEGIPAHTYEWFDFKVGSGNIAVLDLLERAEQFTKDVYAKVTLLL